VESRAPTWIRATSGVLQVMGSSKLVAQSSRPGRDAFVVCRVTLRPAEIRSRRAHSLARLPLVLLAFALASSACTARGSQGKEPATRNAGVIELRNVAELRQRFNTDAGKTRLILLISPT